MMIMIMMNMMMIMIIIIMKFLLLFLVKQYLYNVTNYKNNAYFQFCQVHDLYICTVHEIQEHQSWILQVISVFGKKLIWDIPVESVIRICTWQTINQNSWSTLNTNLKVSKSAKLLKRSWFHFEHHRTVKMMLPHLCSIYLSRPCKLHQVQWPKDHPK